METLETVESRVESRESGVGSRDSTPATVISYRPEAEDQYWEEHLIIPTSILVRVVAAIGPLEGSRTIVGTVW
jgi:hypothetical protein